MEWFKKNWKFMAIVAAVLVLAIVVVLVVPKQGGGAADAGALDDGVETGVYYYDTEEGEYILTLNSGNAFTIAGPSLNKSGKYKVTETGIELDFVRDEDGMGSIVKDGSVMILQYKDRTMRFLEKKTLACGSL